MRPTRMRDRRNQMMNMQIELWSGLDSQRSCSWREIGTAAASVLFCAFAFCS